MKINYADQLKENISSELEVFRDAMRKKGKGSKYIASEKRLMKDCMALMKFGNPADRKKASALLARLKTIRWMQKKGEHIPQKTLEGLKI